MRKKLREIMDKEEGFTLVELLAVIVILGIILAIAIPSVGNVINKANEGATSAEEELVIDAARLYIISEKENKVSKDMGGTGISVDTLKSEGYLETKKKLEGAVKVTEKDGKRTYEYGSTIVGGEAAEATPDSNGE